MTATTVRPLQHHKKSEGSLLSSGFFQRTIGKVLPTHGRFILGMSLAVLCVVKFAPPVNAEVVKLEAPGIFEKSITQHLRLSEDGTEMELEAGELFEDDGPASGHSYQKPSNVEVVTPNTWIKKELIIPNPQARAAYLVVLSEDPFEATINGVPYKFGESQSGRKSYKTCAFDPRLLKAGRNEIVLRDSGRVLIARDDEFALGSRTRTKHPNRSAKSTDAGKTWDYNHLGLDGKLDGEYGVRIFLDHYRPQGKILTPYSPSSLPSRPR